jgi:peptidyl-prolyl cis-trans isomerase C/peptidyl-prolyl cis-trans isomerase D
MKRFRSLASFSIFGFIFISALGFYSNAQNKDAVVATVGSKTITLEDFNKKYNEIKSQTVNPPTKDQFLEDLVRYEVGLQEAEKKKLQNDPLVQERMRQELYKALLDREIGEKIQKTSVTDKEMQAYYKNNPEIRTSHILIEVKPGATVAQRAEAKKRAQEIYEEVRKSKRPFEELVRLYSDDPLNKQTGGDVGWQTRISLVPSYYDTVVKMKVGDLSPLVETAFGFHIIKVTGRRSYENANKRQLRIAVFDEKRRETFNEYFDKVKKGYKIQTNKKLIE